MWAGNSSNLAKLHLPTRNCFTVTFSSPVVNPEPSWGQATRGFLPFQPQRQQPLESGRRQEEAAVLAPHMLALLICYWNCSVSSNLPGRVFCPTLSLCLSDAVATYEGRCFEGRVRCHFPFVSLWQTPSWKGYFHYFGFLLFSGEFCEV